MLELVRNRHFGIWLVVMLALAVLVMPSVAGASHGADEDVPHGKVVTTTLEGPADHDILCSGYSVAYNSGLTAKFGATTFCSDTVDNIKHTLKFQIYIPGYEWATLDTQWEECENPCSNLVTEPLYEFDEIWIDYVYRVKTVHEMWKSGHTPSPASMTTYDQFLCC